MIPSWLIVLFALILTCYAYEEIYNYQLPDDDPVKSLNVTINREMFKPVIHVYCNNYDSLKYLEIRQSPFYPYVVIELTFVGCFNNKTDNENYKYRLWDVISSIPNFSEHDRWSEIDLALDHYAEVNSDTLLENFNFTKFKNTNFENFGFETSRYLTNHTCIYCKYNNIKHLDLNDIRSDLNADDAKFSQSELINFNSDNLKKFRNITMLDIGQFSLADQNAFNVPRLFEYNANLEVMYIDGSQHKIVLHENVFEGLHEIRGLSLTNLQLDNIPEKLFSGMHKTRELILNSNNIKTLHPNSFGHSYVLTVRIQENPIFTMSHDKIEGLTIKTNNLYLSNFTKYTYNVVEDLLNNPDINNLNFETLLADPIDISEFTKVNVTRTSFLPINFSGGQVALDLDYVKLHGTPKKSARNIYKYQEGEELSVVVTLPIKKSLCDDCWLMNQFIENYFDEQDNFIEFYFKQGGALIRPQVSCARQIYRFEQQFETNCPASCKCKYNGLLDKIIINCSNANLTEIPIIPYPEQFENIATIDLHFDNNFLTNLNFENQNDKVLEKISTLKFHNNNIQSVTLPDSFKNTVFLMDLCRNEGFKSADINKLEIAADPVQADQEGEGCMRGSQYPSSPASYVKDNKSKREIKEYIDSVCKSREV